MTGATDPDECPRPNRRRACTCEPCSVCGHGKHAAIHGPELGSKPGSKPWGHQYEEPKR